MEHYFTKLVVLKSHTNDKHNGLRDTINNFHEEFWTLKGRNFVKVLLTIFLFAENFMDPVTKGWYFT